MADERSFREVWNAMPRWQRAGTFALGVVEIIATTAAVVDLVRRPRDEVRGPKALWWPALTVQPVGPFAYLALGRRRRG
jgi:hypothetical protein